MTYEEAQKELVEGGVFTLSLVGVQNLHKRFPGRYEELQDFEGNFLSPKEKEERINAATRIGNWLRDKNNFNFIKTFYRDFLLEEQKKWEGGKF